MEQNTLSTTIVINNFEIPIIGLQNINFELKTHNLIYKITNSINGHFYIGKHSTNYPIDDYMGSGVIINDAYKKELELIPEISCHQYNECCYNMKPGGYGGCTSDAAIKAANTRRKHNYSPTKETRQKIGKANKGKKRTKKQRKHISVMTKKNAVRGKNHPQYGKTGNLSPCYGRKHTLEERIRIGKNRKYKYGKENHCYGKKKVIDPKTNKGKLVKIEDIQHYLDLGYKLSKFSSYKVM